MSTSKALARIAREPLVQFAVLGALLFAADRYVLSNSDNPRRIVIDTQKREELSAMFEEGQGRAPGPEELQNLIVQWSQNEVLYREARLMGLDQGDDMIRERLILKLRNILFNNVVVDEPRAGELEAWFEAHRAAYDRPEFFDFEQFEVSGDDDDSVAAALAATLGSAPPPPERADNVRRYQARPATNLAALFGDEGTRQLIAGADGAWRAVRSSKAWHLARVTRRHPAQPANFDAISSHVMRDYKAQAQKADLSLALKNIVEQYAIEVTPDAERRPEKLSKSDVRPEGDAP